MLGMLSKENVGFLTHTFLSSAGADELSKASGNGIPTSTDDGWSGDNGSSGCRTSGNSGKLFAETGLIRFATIERLNKNLKLERFLEKSFRRNVAVHVCAGNEGHESRVDAVSPVRNRPKLSSSLNVISVIVPELLQKLLLRDLCLSSVTYRQCQAA